MEVMAVAVGAEFVDFGVGFFQAGDLFAGEVGGQAFLPVTLSLSGLGRRACES